MKDKEIYEISMTLAEAIMKVGDTFYQDHDKDPEKLFHWLSAMAHEAHMTRTQLINLAVSFQVKAVMQHDAASSS